MFFEDYQLKMIHCKMMAISNDWPTDGLAVNKWDFMMTSWYECTFNITGPLCGESTGYQWISWWKGQCRFSELCLNKLLKKKQSGQWNEASHHSCDITLMCKIWAQYILTFFLVQLLAKCQLVLVHKKTFSDNTPMTFLCETCMPFVTKMMNRGINLFSSKETRFQNSVSLWLPFCWDFRDWTNDITVYCLTHFPLDKIADFSQTIFSDAILMN